MESLGAGLAVPQQNWQNWADVDFNRRPSVVRHSRGWSRNSANNNKGSCALSQNGVDGGARGRLAWRALRAAAASQTAEGPAHMRARGGLWLPHCLRRVSLLILPVAVWGISAGGSGGHEGMEGRSTQQQQQHQQQQRRR